MTEVPCSVSRRAVALIPSVAERGGGGARRDRVSARRRGWERARTSVRYPADQPGIRRLVVVALPAVLQRLHSEAVAELVRIVPASLQPILQRDWTTGRRLDHGNPNAGNIGSDFHRLGMTLWDDVYAMHRLNRRRREILDEMILWRNAIGHQDFNNPALGGATIIHLRNVQGYRRTCNALAGFLDRAALDHIHAVAGPASGW
jgi:hypothetical protein